MGDIRLGRKAIKIAYGLDPRLDFVKVDSGSQELDFGILVPHQHEPLTNFSLLSGHRSVLKPVTL
jgi:hypothetical protein